MDVGDFEFILGKISHLISPRQMSNFGGHLPIMPDERLALTLRYIATGKSFQSLSFQFRISLTAVSYIIKGCCNALVDELVPVLFKTPFHRVSTCPGNPGNVLEFISVLEFVLETTICPGNFPKCPGILF